MKLEKVGVMENATGCVLGRVGGVVGRLGFRDRMVLLLESAGIPRRVTEERPGSGGEPGCCLCSARR